MTDLQTTSQPAILPSPERHRKGRRERGHHAKPTVIESPAVRHAAALRRRRAAALRLAWIAAIATAAAWGVRSTLHDPAPMLMGRMETALDGVRSAHMLEYEREYVGRDGATKTFDKPQAVDELWYHDGRWRREGVWGSRLIVAQPQAAALCSRYDSRRKHVVTLPQRGSSWNSFSLDTVTGLDLDPSDNRFRTVRREGLNGHATSEVLVERIGSEATLRSLCWIDRHTALPVRIELQDHIDGGWRTESRFDFQFGPKIPARLFDPKTLHDDGWTLPKA